MLRRARKFRTDIAGASSARPRAVLVSLLRGLAEAVEAGVAVASATVVDTARSVPRHAGAKMLVFRDGSIAGTVGGGEMEARVVSEAQSSLADGRCRLLSYRLVDPGRGDPGVCGGDVRIFVEPHMPKPTIIIMGYGHVGRAVAELAHWLDFRVVVTDDRPGIGPEAALTDTRSLADGAAQVEPVAVAAQSELVDEFISGGVADLLEHRTLDADASVVLVTRNVDVDVAALPALLDTDAGYIGVMGSERRWTTTKSRLVAAGVSEETLSRLRAPIGVEVGAETPQEIALSILAEVIGHRRS